jgi:hypothetical protein
MNPKQNIIIKKLKHFQRPSSDPNKPRQIKNHAVDNTIPKITGLKENSDLYRLDIRNIDFTTTPPTPSTDPDNLPLFQFSFPVYESLRDDFPDYNAGDYCDPSYQGNGHTSFLLLDFFITDTRQTAARIIIQGNKITGVDTSPYIFNFLSAKNSLFHIMRNLKKGETMNNISIVITPYDDQSYSGFPLVIMFDKFANKSIFNQYEIDAFHTIRSNDVKIVDFRLGSYYCNFFTIPNYQMTNSDNIDISGCCNNNQYGVNFLFRTTSINPYTSKDLISNFMFYLYPYSNVPGINSDFPVSFKDKTNKHFGTMYANDPSIRFVTELGTKLNPTVQRKNYFQLFNLPRALIMKKDNMGIDSLMKLNKQFFQNSVIVPNTTRIQLKPKSIEKIFIIKDNKKNKIKKGKF